MPPTERRGRVQTSTVTVAVMDPEHRSAVRLRDSDVEIRTSRGSGPGGQHRNKTDSCVTAVHVPTGISVRVDMRSQHESRRVAMQILGSKVGTAAMEAGKEVREASRRSQVGTGMRGDKVRTYREQDDRVTDHRTGRTWKLSAWRRGRWE